MNNKILLTSINFLIVIAIVFWLILPKFDALKDLNLKIDIKDLEIQTQENYFKNLDDISKKLDSFPTEVAKVNSAIPDALSVHSLLNLLQEKSSNSGLILKKIDFDQSSALKENPKIISLSASLELAGSYQAFKNFLKSLEKSARMIEFNNFSISSSQKAEKGNYTFKLGLKAYSY